MYLDVKTIKILSEPYKNYMRIHIINAVLNNDKWYLPINGESFVQFLNQYKLNIDYNTNTIFFDLHFYAPINSANHGKLFKELQKEYFRHNIYLYDETFLSGGTIKIYVTRKLCNNKEEISYHNLNKLPFIVKELDNSLDYCAIM